ncbi:MAG: hypothetical protein ABL982_25830, partial [Vicinamibacterales bacterium]
MPFRTIIGHRKLIALLSRSIGRESLPPSLIFAGPSGVGKRMAALATAQALNCLAPITSGPADSPDVDACGTCAACTRIVRGIHPDVLMIEPNDKGNIKIDPVREAIRQSGYRPFEGRRRVTIIESADGLDATGQNALLKVLEEPPASSVFILVTALPDTLLVTVRSRCPLLRFRALATDDVVSALQQHPDRHVAYVLVVVIGVGEGESGADAAVRQQGRPASPAFFEPLLLQGADHIVGREGA